MSFCLKYQINLELIHLSPVFGTKLLYTLNFLY